MSKGGCGTMADLVRYTLSDGAEVFFESAESAFVSARGGCGPEVADGGPLEGRLHTIAAAAEEVASSLRSRLTPDAVTLQFGVTVGGEASWWFFAKNTAEATITVTLKWSTPQGE